MGPKINEASENDDFHTDREGKHEIETKLMSWRFATSEVGKFIAVSGDANIFVRTSG